MPDFDPIQEHRELLEEISSLEVEVQGNRTDFLLLQDIEGKLKRHVYIEEELLFSDLTGEEERRVARGMEYEHASLFLLIEKLEKALLSGNMDAARKKAGSILRLAAMHFTREEGMLYSEGKIRCITHLGDVSLPIPAGWRCRLLRERGQATA